MHRFWTAVLGIVVLFGVQVLAGNRRVALPASAVSLPYRSLVPLGMSMSILGVRSSMMRGSESVAARRVGTWCAVAVASLVVLVVALEYLLATASGRPSVGTEYTRSLLIWLGIASAGHAALRVGWAVALASLLPLMFLDPYRGGRPASWNWPLQDVDSRETWWICAAALLLAAIATGTTRWRLRNLIHRPRRDTAATAASTRGLNKQR